MSEQDDDTTSSSVSAAERATKEADETPQDSENAVTDRTTQDGENAGTGEVPRGDDTAGANGATRDAAAGGSSQGSGDTVLERLSEIARQPEADVGTALSGILEDDADEAGSREGDRTDEGPLEGDVEAIADEVAVDDELVATIRDADPETTARAIQLLSLGLDQAEERVAEHRERAEDLESRLKRKQADFQNYKKRRKKRKQEEIERATEDLVSRLLDVRDNLKRALDHDDAEIRSGVESTLTQFDNELERENVEPIEPGPGDAVDPQRHEVLATIASDQPEDTIAERHRPGYEMAGKVLRPAQVAVSDGSEHDDSENGPDGGADTGD